MNDSVEVLKQIRNFILIDLLIKLASDRDFLTTWLQSFDASVDTGDIPPGTSIQIYLPKREGWMFICEKIAWKLNEWWTTNIEWYRDGINIFSESNAVDGETPVRVIPAYDSSYVSITNNSTTVNVRCMLRWHYAYAKRDIYESFSTGVFKQATDVIEEVAGIKEEEA